MVELWLVTLGSYHPLPPYHNYSLIIMSCSSLVLSLILVTPRTERPSKSMLGEKLVPEVIRGSWLYFIMNVLGHLLGRQRRGSTQWPNYIGKERYTVTMLIIYFLAVISKMAETVKTAILSSSGWGGPACLSPWLKGLSVQMAYSLPRFWEFFFLRVLCPLKMSCLRAQLMPELFSRASAIWERLFSWVIQG